MGASIIGPVTSVQFLDNIGFQFNFTGTPVGTFDVQVSADHSQDLEGNVTVAGNWTSIPFSTQPAAAGAGATIYIDINQISAPYMRAIYTRTSGTGTLNAFITAKMV